MVIDQVVIYLYARTDGSGSAIIDLNPYHVNGRVFPVSVDAVVTDNIVGGRLQYFIASYPYSPSPIVIDVTVFDNYIVTITNSYSVSLAAGYAAIESAMGNYPIVGPVEIDIISISVRRDIR
ncbi:MAG: hypothetical protein ABSG73_08365, partial [Candidatus Aminicenantales bacterium]